MMNENERVKVLRKDYLHLTLVEFGEKVGVRHSTISNIENGIRSVTDQMRTSICREFHVREEWLRNGNGEPFEPDPESELDALCDRYGLEEGSRAFIKEFAELPDNERKIILKYIEKVCASLRGEEPAAANISDQDAREQLHADLDRELALQKGQEGKSTGSGSTAV